MNAVAFFFGEVTPHVKLNKKGMGEQAEHITFNGRRVWQAVIYHLYQRQQPHWHATYWITLDSLCHLHRCLHRRKTTISLNAKTWRQLSDVARLQWLMHKAGIGWRRIEGTQLQGRWVMEVGLIKGNDGRTAAEEAA